jgi:hypothetical protein
MPALLDVHNMNVQAGDTCLETSVLITYKRNIASQSMMLNLLLPARTLDPQTVVCILLLGCGLNKKKPSHKKG